MQPITVWRRMALSLVVLVLLLTLLVVSTSAATLMPDGAATSSFGASHTAVPETALMTNSEVVSDSEPITPSVDLAQVPLAFVPNVGQSDSSVEYQLQGLGGTLYFAEEEVVLVLPAPTGETDSALSEDGGQDISTPGEALEQQTAIPPIVTRLELDGAASPSAVTALDPLPGVVNYYIGDDPSQWLEEVPTYGSLVYHDVYPGVDVHYDGTQGHLKSNYLLEPGADPTQIRWRYEGATDLSIDELGRLHVTLAVSDSTQSEGGSEVTPAPELIEETPLAWQTIDGEYVPVDLGYDIGEDGSIGFVVGTYDTTQPLVLDPTLSYSTFLGGSGNDYGLDITLGNDGNFIIAGRSDAQGYPTANAQDPSYNGQADAIVTKMDPTGTIVFSTYLGGENYDVAWGISKSSNYGAVVTGYTRSTAFPSKNPVAGMGSALGSNDVFVTYFNNNGTMAASTRLGGSSSDIGESIVEYNGAVYVTGSTASSSFPKTANAYDSTLNGPTDAFVSKLTWAGGTNPIVLSYGTFLGGSGGDYGTAIDVGGSRFHVGGYFTSTAAGITFPTVSPLPIAYRQDADGDDAFLTRFSISSNALLASTYLGGEGKDELWGLAAAGSGNAYITGRTYSTLFPLVNPFQSQLNQNGTTNWGDAFVAKVNAAGSDLLYSTYLGGQYYEAGYDIAVDQSTGYATIAGYSSSTNLPTQTPLQAQRSGSVDVLVARLNFAGNGLLFSTYLGGTAVDYGYGVALDDDATIYLTGQTDSSNFPTMNAPYNHAGLYDAFVSMISFRPSAVLAYYYRHYPKLDNDPSLSPPNLNTVQIADYTGMVILNKRKDDGHYLTQTLRISNSYDSLALQYVLANELQNNSGFRNNNQWGYRSTDWDTFKYDADAFLWQCSLAKEAITDTLCSGGVILRIGPDGLGNYLMDPANAEWQALIEERAAMFITDSEPELSRRNYGFHGYFLDNVHLTLDAARNRAYRKSNGRGPDEMEDHAYTAVAETSSTAEDLTATQPIYRCAQFDPNDPLQIRALRSTCTRITNEEAYRQDFLESVALVRQELDEVEAARLADGDPSNDYHLQLWGNMIGDPYSGSSWNDFMESPAGMPQADMDGGMFEGWTTDFTGNNLGAQDVEDAMTQAQWLIANDKSFFAVGQGVKTDTRRQQLALVSYLMVTPGVNSASLNRDPDIQRALFRYMGPSPTNDPLDPKWWWYTNYTYQLGEPLGPRQEISPNMWRRCFKNGYVLLDLTDPTPPPNPNNGDNNIFEGYIYGQPCP